MSNQSIIEHKANMYYLEFREDYLQICNECTYTKPTKDGKKSKASPYCKALILAILEHWTNDKRSKGDGLYVYMSIPQWVASMYGMFGRNVIIDSLDELIGEGLIAKLPHKMYGRDTFKYLLNDREMNRRIRLLPERKPTDIYPFTNQRDQFTNQRVASTNQLDTSLQVNDDPFTSKRNIESNIDTNIDSTQMQERVASATSAHALSAQDTSQQGGDRAHETDAALPDVPALDALGLCSGVETVAAPAAFQETLAQKGDTDATSTLPDPDPVHAPTATGNHLHRVEDGRAPVQAEAPVKQTPFSVTSPSDGVVGTASPSGSGPRASGRRGKAQQQDVTQAKLPPAPALQLSPEDHTFYLDYCSLWRSAVPLTPSLSKSLHTLREPVSIWADILKKSRADVLRDIQGWMRKNDKRGYYTGRGIKLHDMERDFEGWQSEQQALLPSDSKKAPNPKEEDERQRLAEYRRLVKAREAQAAGGKA